MEGTRIQLHSPEGKGDPEESGTTAMPRGGAWTSDCLVGKVCSKVNLVLGKTNFKLLESVGVSYCHQRRGGCCRMENTVTLEALQASQGLGKRVFPFIKRGMNKARKKDVGKWGERAMCWGQQIRELFSLRTGLESLSPENHLLPLFSYCCSPFSFSSHLLK